MTKYSVYHFLSMKNVIFPHFLSMTDHKRIVTQSTEFKMLTTINLLNCHRINLINCHRITWYSQIINNIFVSSRSIYCFQHNITCSKSAFSTSIPYQINGEAINLFLSNMSIQTVMFAMRPDSRNTFTVGYRFTAICIMSIWKMRL